MATCADERDLNECPVCMEEYQKPQILPCNHSLCEQCLSRIIEDEIVRCPLCNATSSKFDVKHDFRLAQFLEVLKNRSEKSQVLEQNKR